MKVKTEEKHTHKKLHSAYTVQYTLVYISVADPDPKDPHNFAGSGSIIFSIDPDPDLNLTNFSPPP